MLQHLHTSLETAGHLIRLRTNSDLDPNKDKPSENTAGKRAAINGFSKKSRLAFARALAATEWPLEPSHVTLTYGQLTRAMVQDPLYFKADLKMLGKYLARHGMAGFWRLEFQERKQTCLEFLSRSSVISAQQISLMERHGRAAHFHLLLTQCTVDQEAKLRRFWNRRISESLALSAKHYKAEFGALYSVKVTRRESGRASWYLALHGQKDTQAPSISVGAWWGYFGKAEMMQLQTWHNYGELSAPAEFRLRRILRRLTNSKTNGKAIQSMTVFLGQKTQRRLITYLYDYEEELNRHDLSNCPF